MAIFLKESETIVAASKSVSTSLTIEAILGIVFFNLNCHIV
jgi:hypothetical protein